MHTTGCIFVSTGIRLHILLLLMKKSVNFVNGQHRLHISKMVCAPYTCSIWPADFMKLYSNVYTIMCLICYQKVAIVILKWRRFSVQKIVNSILPTFLHTEAMAFYSTNSSEISIFLNVYKKCIEQGELIILYFLNKHFKKIRKFSNRRVK